MLVEFGNCAGSLDTASDVDDDPVAVDVTVVVVEEAVREELDDADEEVGDDGDGVELAVWVTWLGAGLAFGDCPRCSRSVTSAKPVTRHMTATNGTNHRGCLTGGLVCVIGTCVEEPVGQVP